MKGKRINNEEDAQDATYRYIYRLSKSGYFYDKTNIAFLRFLNVSFYQVQKIALTWNRCPSKIAWFS